MRKQINIMIANNKILDEFLSALPDMRSYKISTISNQDNTKVFNAIKKDFSTHLQQSHKT